MTSLESETYAPGCSSRMSVPCARNATADGAIPSRVSRLSIPAAMPSDWSCGVEGRLKTHSAPRRGSRRQKSVKVPPTSTPSRIPIRPSLSVDVRVEPVPETVPQEVAGHDRDEDRETRERQVPPGPEHVVAPRAHERPPLRRRRRHAEAEEAEARDGEDGVADVEARLDQHRRDAVGKDVHQPDAH